MGAAGPGRRSPAAFSLVVAVFVVMLFTSPAAAAPVNYTARYIDPENDVHISASTGMGNANEGQQVDGHESIDIVRVTSLAENGILTLTMDLAGSADRTNYYAFAIQVSSDGHLWNDRDAVAMIHNGSASLYLSANLTAHDIDRATRLDATTGANIEARTARIALNVAILGSVEHYDLEGYAFKPRLDEKGNQSGYFFDWTRNAQLMSGDFWGGFLASWGTLLLLMVFLFVVIIAFRYRESMNRKAASRPCKYCKKPVSRGLIFCPACGKEVDYKNE